MINQKGMLKGFLIIIGFSISTFSFSFKTEAGFLENKGQLPPNVLYYAQLENQNVLITKEGFSYDNFIPEGNEYKHHRIEFEMLNSNGSYKIKELNKIQGYTNYYLDGKVNQGLNKYSKIRFLNVYRNIDIEFSILNGKFKYDVFLHPGADINDIRIRIKGADAEINSENILLNLDVGILKEYIPYSFLGSVSENHKVKVKFVAKDKNIFGFSSNEKFENVGLIIDPTPQLSWATYHGGSSTDEYSYSELDKKGYVYSIGKTYSSSNISTTGAYRTTLQGGMDAYISKFDTSGRLIWSTYFGGNSNEDFRGIDVDTIGDVIVVGSSTSSGLATSGAYKTSLSGSNDGMIVKFSSTGSLLWSTYYGGSSSDEFYHVETDEQNNIYAAGKTSSTSGIATSGAHNGSYSGGEDAFLVSFNASGSLNWGTYFGGSGQDFITSIYAKNVNEIFLLGYTASSGLAFNAQHKSTYSGGGDVMYAKFKSNGSFDWLNYFGNTSLDYAIKINGRDSSIYFCGYTDNTSQIATTGAFQTVYSGSSDGYLAKMALNGKIEWCTYIGGTGFDEVWNLSVAPNTVYIAGRTTSSSGLSSTSAFQTNNAGGSDLFINRFTSSGNRIWGTYYGGSGNETHRGLLYFGNALYVSGYTTSSSGFTTSGAHQSSYGGSQDAILVKFENLGCGNMSASYKVLKSTTCPGDSDAVALIIVTDNNGPVSYHWKTSPPIYKDTATNLPAGVYQVVYQDSSGCKDSINVHITEPIKLRAVVKDSSHMSCAGTADGYLVAGYFGGTGPYNVKWNTSPVQSGDTARNLSKGTYKFVVTDINQCKDSASATILEPDTLKISISGFKNASCFMLNDGYISVSVKGGWVPYKYLWNTSPPQTGSTAFNLTAGYYEAIITDNNGCKGKIGYTLTEPSPLTIGILNHENARCFGDSTGQISALVWGGTPGYSYSWNTVPPTYNLNINYLKKGTYVFTARDVNNCTSVKSVVINEPDPLKIDFDSIQNVVCNGDKSGSVKANFSGGTAPYSYSWNTAPITTDAYLKNVPAGSYVFHLIDTNACFLRDTITLTQQDTILTTADISDVTCAGLSNGSIRLQVKGGTPPFTYKWSHDSTLNFPDAFDLKAGRYNLTLTDAYSCTQSYIFDVREPDTLKIHLNLTKHIRCFNQNDGAISVSISGGTLPYDLQWNTNPPSRILSLDSLKAGKYNASVTDQNGCADSLQVILTEPLRLTGTFDSLASPNCFQSPTGFVRYKAGGGVRPYKYSFNFTSESNDSFNAAVKAGMIHLKLTDANGCVLYDSVQLIDQKPLSISADVRNVKCFDTKTGSIFINAQGGVLPYEYNWSPTFTDTNYIDHLDIGIYSLTLKDRFGCLLKDSFLISQPTKLTAKKELEVPVSCYGRNNGIAAGSASGGMPGYRWFWNSTQRPSSSQINDLYAGRHVLYVMDSFNCIDSLVFNISEPARIKALASQYRKPTCVGWSDGRAMATPIPGVGPYSYKWSDGQTVQEATGLAKGNYTVIITDACGDTAIASVSIEDPEPFIIPNILGVDRTRSGHSQTYEMKYDSSWRYEWKISGGEILSGAGTHQIKVRWTHPNQGILSVTVTNGQGCTDEVSMVINLFVRCLEVYPNPSDDITHVFSAYADGSSELEAYDARGRKVMTWPAALDYNVDVSHWSRGIYFFRYKDCVIKFLKE